MGRSKGIEYAFALSIANADKKRVGAITLVQELGEAHVERLLQVSPEGITFGNTVQWYCIAGRPLVLSPLRTRSWAMGWANCHLDPKTGAIMRALFDQLCNREPLPVPKGRRFGLPKGGRRGQTKHTSAMTNVNPDRNMKNVRSSTS